MPLIKVEITEKLSEEEEADLLKALSATVAEELGKPEQYVMATVSVARVLMSGDFGPAAFVEVRSIGGLNARVNGKMSAAICSLLSHSLAISPERVYLNFMDLSAENWGWDSRTFAG